MADNKDVKTTDPRADGPLHRPAARIDAGKTPDSNDGALVTPSTNEHAAMPDSPLADGQVSKM